MAQAGFPRRAEGYDDLGVALGSFTAGVHASAEYLETYLRQGAGASPAILFSNTVGNAPASVCALELGLRGPNATLTHKEASGLAAIEFAARLIRRGRAPAVLAGGADVLELVFYRVHDWFEVMAPDHEPCRPYDAGAARFPDGRRRVPVRARGRRARPGPRRPHPRPRHRHGVGGIARRVQRLADRAGHARAGDARRDRARRPRRPTRSTSSTPPPTAARCSTPPRRGRCAPCSAIAPCRWWRSRARSASPAPPAAPGSRPRCCSRSAASRRPRSVWPAAAPTRPPGARSEAQPVGGRRALVLSVGSGGTVVAVVVEAA